MEGFLEALGIAGLVLLLIIGVLAGWLASLVAGGNQARYIVTGVVAALLTPLLLAAIGVGLLAAGGLAAILVAAVVGAVVVLLIVRLVTD
ncbi:hypothetical protein BH23PSE1_BH23PSE1_16730 [soil metagenome]